MNTPKNQYHPQIFFHPGESLAEKLEEMGMNAKEFAMQINVPEKTILAIRNLETGITPELAVRFEEALKIPAHFWVNKQRGFDEM